MSEVLQANVFFFITAMAVVVFTLLLSVALFHLIKVIRTVRRIVEKVEEGTEVLAEDVKQVRTYFSEGAVIPRLMQTLMGKGRGRRRKKQSDLSEEDNDPA